MTKNEQALIDALKNNKDFVYLITQPLENLTVDSQSATATKGLSIDYPVLPDKTIHFLLMLMCDNYYIGPIKSTEKIMTQADIDKAVRAVINCYLMIVCLDKVITKYKQGTFHGYTAEHSYKSSWTNTHKTLFYMDSKSKSVEFKIELLDSSAITEQSPSEFMKKAIVQIDAHDATFLSPYQRLGSRVMTLSKITDAIENLLFAC